MTVDWCKCILQSSCRLNLINLNTEYFDNLLGVFVIWYENKGGGKIVSVGQGIIRDKLIEMQIDKKVQEYGPDLYVTWASVPRVSLEGIEAFLYQKLNPLVHHSITSCDTIEVNLPQLLMISKKFRLAYPIITEVDLELNDRDDGNLLARPQKKLLE